MAWRGPEEVTTPLSRRPVWAAPDTSGRDLQSIAATAVIAATARDQPPGASYTRRQRWGWPTAVVAGVVNGTFGVTVIALEAFLH